ncbi:GrpB family protein [Glutamicibacter nicotianae]|uniref:GrpB family protein n=1 Tax=Glutamicibacter nicotianae TaxID=37929 RepID=UPI002555CE32|nr:GrpB family protein [Glutamicibacter nicotianae]WIV45235.1 GrpB family protein [Glutamicibacter nicotianae]
MTSEWFDKPGGEPVELYESDPLWPLIAAEWTNRIQSNILPTLARVEHVGSTSIPGLIAKPVLDLQIAVPDLNDEAAYRTGLESLGLVLRQREPDHRFFRPPAGEPRLVHVHVCEQGSVWEHGVLRFRDRVRVDPKLAAEYATLKLGLADRFGTHRLNYNNGKAQFISRVIAGE